MSDPSIRSLVCPTCNQHAYTRDGLFMPHEATDGSGSACANTGRSVTAGRRYREGSQFESCPGATGEARPPCPDFPDGAHRCGHNRDHVRVSRQIEHSCTCGAVWFAQMGTLDDLVELMNRRPS